VSKASSPRDQSRTFVSNVPSSPASIRAPSFRRHHAIPDAETDASFIRSRIRQEFGPHQNPTRRVSKVEREPVGIAFINDPLDENRA
ncbi:hypothetical protein, partial [Rhodopirellula bahusiensis]